MNQREKIEAAVPLLQSWLDQDAAQHSKRGNYDPEKLIALLDEWSIPTEEELQDQRETMAILREGLNRGRPKGYEIFP